MDTDQQYRKFFESSPDAFLIMRGSAFIDCNDVAVRMLRYPDKASLLTRFEHFHPGEISPARQPDGRDSFEKAEEILEFVAREGTHTFEWMHLDALGEPFFVEVQLTEIGQGQDRVVHVVWRDIRKRKLLEESLRRAQRLEAVGRLSAGVAHDFNNLLVVILGHAELLAAEMRAGAGNPAHVDEIRDATERATRLTRQLLAFSRGQPKQLQATSFAELVSELGSFLSRLIGEHIELKIETSAGSSVVMADPGQLEQVIVNLAVNARDAMPDGGLLRISVSSRIVNPGRPVGNLSAGDYVVLRVADTGTGMSSDQLEHVFEPFYTTKTSGKGTGLGLATVQAIVDESGGLVRIESEPDQGTTVEVLLPRCDTEPVATETASPVHGDATRTATILLAEDEKPIRELFETTLRARGYTVVSAADGQEAWERIAHRDSPVDLIVSDVKMPRLSGPDLAIKAMGRWPQTKVLLISGYSDEPALDEIGGRAGVSVLAKPLTLGKLQDEIRRILGSDGQPAGS